jgi:Cdc6-like AAA superfamily ATPase
LYDFAGDIIDCLGISRSTITIPSQEDLKLEPRQFVWIFLKEIYSRLDGKSVVLLLDEFDILLDDNSNQINPLINFLTSIINRGEKLFIILFLGRRKKI